MASISSLVMLNGCHENQPQSPIPAAQQSKKPPTTPRPKRPPQPLDLDAHYSEKYNTPAPGTASADGITGKKSFDGVPFLVNGTAFLFGSQMAQNASKKRDDYPDVIGVKVGRSFDELHLLHTTKWPDVDGTTIARARLHYSDGTTRELDIGYGVHVRDWQRLQSEQREALTHPQSKVVWRGPGMEKFKSSQRMFKSVLINPLKAKRVDTIDFISTGQVATYCLHAATVADADPKRPVSPPPAQDRPESNFDGQIVVRILDQEGNPIKGAYVDTSLSVMDTTWLTSGAPFYTSEQGTGVVKFPKLRTEIIILNVSKTGWKSEKKQLDFTGDENQKHGAEVTLRLSPST